MRKSARLFPFIASMRLVHSADDLAIISTLGVFATWNKIARWSSHLREAKYSGLVSSLNLASSIIDDTRFLNSVTFTGTSFHQQSVWCPLKTSSACPRGFTHSSTYTRLSVVRAPSTFSTTVTSQGALSVVVLSASLVLISKSLRSSLSLPKRHQRKASKCRLLPSPFAPDIVVSVGEKVVVRSLSPRKPIIVMDSSLIVRMLLFVGCY